MASILGTRIRELRRANRLSQIELAEKLSVSKQSISNWENNNIMPAAEMVVKIAAFFHCSTDYLFGVDGMISLEKAGLTMEQFRLVDGLIEQFQKMNRREPAEDE